MDDHADWDSVLQFIAEPNVDDKSTRDDPASQIPTPPLSHGGSPIAEVPPPDSSTLVSVSTTFFPGALHHSALPDLILLSDDSVFFYVHAHLLLCTSSNAFNALLPQSSSSSKDPDQIVDVPENSAILNIILHAIYDMSCAHYSPSLSQLCTAVRCLPVYGIDPKSHITPTTPLYTLLLSHAPLYPLELYTIAANFDLYDLAVATSSHLLSFPLSSLTDEMAGEMGPVYLKRLFFLHFGRSDALKRVLLSPPHPHPPTSHCDFSDQKKLTRAWALASAYLAWDARPDLSTSTMESALRPLEEHLSCDDCREALRYRIKNLIIQWSIVKRTI